MLDPDDIDLTAFLTSWYGPPNRVAVPIPLRNAWLPGPLKDWHELASKWEASLTYTTSMVEPDNIKPTKDGKCIFMVDSTGDWRWSFATNAPDTVFDAEQYEPWEKNPETLSEFLLHNSVREAVYGAKARLRAISVPDDALAGILSSVQEVSFGSWTWPGPGYRTFMSDDLIIEICQHEDGSGWELEIGARNPLVLSAFENIEDLDWRRPRE